MSGSNTVTSAEPNFTPGVEIDLGDNPGREFFNSWDEVRTFLTEDNTAWAPFFASYQQQFANVGGPLQVAYTDHQKSLQTMIQSVGGVNTSVPFTNSIRINLETILQPYLNGTCIHSKSHKGVFILGSRGPAPQEKFSAYILAISTNRNSNMNSLLIQTNRAYIPGPNFISGIVVGKLLDLGLYENGKIDLERSNDYVNELANSSALWKQKLSSLDLDLAEFHSKISGMENDFLSRKREVSLENEKFLSDLQKQSSELRDAHEREMENIRKAFKDEIKLRAAREYWNQVVTENKKSARIFWCLFLASLPAAIITICFGVNSMLFFLKNSGLNAATSEWFIVGMPTVLTLWVVRSIHRQWSTYNGLANDARERVTMVQTYLALVSEGNMSDTERPMVLQPLFRPSAVAGDDGMYKGIIDHLIDAVNRPKGGQP